MSTLTPATAANYAEAVLGDIERCIEACRLADPRLTEMEALEQIHALKNAVAPTGSAELLQACEQIRLDACQRGDRSALAPRYKAIANAAALLVRRYAQTLTIHENSPVNHG